MTPRVSCVCPTGDRPRYLAQAVEIFESQTFKDAELVVLDDGETASPVVLGERIRYFRMKPRRLTRVTVGEKRNSLNTLTLGEIICHLDDDDWSHPERVARQVEILDTRPDVQVTGYWELGYWREVDRAFFRYVYNGRPGDYACGTSLCYRRAWWLAHPFKHKPSGEDADFAFEARDRKVLLSIKGSSTIVARCHAANTYRPTLGSNNFPHATAAELPEEFHRWLARH